MNDETRIKSIINNYIEGLHHGDAALLAGLFHPDSMLQAPGLKRSLSTWLHDVSHRPIPSAIGHPAHYQILWIDIEGDQAMAKVDCPLPGGHYLDYLGFLREAETWKIVNKMYAEKPLRQPSNFSLTHKPLP